MRRIFSKNNIFERKNFKVTAFNIFLADAQRMPDK